MGEVSIHASELDNLIADPNGRVHFVGCAGSGMSALADYWAGSGRSCSGSDRFFDRGEMSAERARQEAMGIQIFPQDGSGVQGASLVVASTAVEAQISDLIEAKTRGCPIAHRAVFLAALVRQRTTIAVAGSSGKSTVVAMLFELLRGAGLNPGVISGGDLVCLKQDGRRGNAYHGDGILIIEADESDKSLVHYEPDYGLILNLHKDHDDPAMILPVFQTFLNQIRKQSFVSGDPALAALQGSYIRFGIEAEEAGVDAAQEAPELMAADEAMMATRIRLAPDHSQFEFRGRDYNLPIPGRHNVENAAAALALGEFLGLDQTKLSAAIKNYRGVSRRFEIIGTSQGIEFIDDFAHNPAKLGATLKTACLRAPRILAAFQPHGFGPTKFMRAEYLDAVCDSLRPADHFFFLEIFFAGGTVTRDISSQELVDELRDRGIQAHYAADGDDLIRQLKTLAQAEDLVLLMGARDPNLPLLARRIHARFRDDENRA